MILNILSWNLNFIHDNYFERTQNINKILMREINDSHIIALQEAISPFSKLYKYIDSKEIKEYTHNEFFKEIDIINQNIQKLFPKKNELIKSSFEYLMDKLLYLIQIIYNKYGEYFKYLYFNYPKVAILLVLFFPFIFILCWFFIGMTTIIHKDIDAIVKCKYIEKMFQYTKFNFNQREIIFYNIHLTAGEKEFQKKKRLNTIKQIYEENKNTDILILAGDFNSKPNTDVYDFLINKGFRSCCMKIKKKELFTFPSNKPRECIDYIWVKGKNIEIKNYEVFGDKTHTDHLGIKASIDIQSL